ncbi:MAG: response regulator, partial [bacterium]|nr:response regulator [bacterium]
MSDTQNLDSDDDAQDAEQADEKSLLIVEDDERFADTLATEFRDRGYAVQHVSDLASLEATDPSAYSYAVVDLRLRRDSGLDAITSIKSRSPGTRVVVLTGYGSIATAVQATKNGATNYLTKPIDMDELEHTLVTGGAGEETPIPDEFQSLDRHEREYIEYVLNECG